MLKFRISYKNGEFSGFNLTEEYENYAEAYRRVVTENKFEVVYPELIRIEEL